MASLKELAASKRDFFMIDPRILMVDDGYNIRDMETPEAKAAQAELEESIAESGIRVPLLVRLKDDAVFVVQGHRRLRAVRSLIERGLPIETIPCIGESRGERNDAERTLDLFLSNDGLPLTEMEKAEGVRRLVAYGWEDGKIASRLGKGVNYVRHLKSLLTMPEEVQEMVRQGEVAAATALKTVRAEGDAAVAVLSEAIAQPPQSPQASMDIGAATPQPEPRRATPTRIEEAAERVAKREGRERQAKKPARREPTAIKAASQINKATTDALIEQVGKFLTKCQNGHYEDDDNEVPDRLAADAKVLAETLRGFKQGFRAEAAE